MQIHIGKIVETIVKQKNISVQQFANQINCSRRNVYTIFKKKDLDTHLLRLISKQLGINIFLYFITDEEMNKQLQKKRLEKIEHMDLKSLQEEEYYITLLERNKNNLEEIIADLKMQINRMKQV